MSETYKNNKVRKTTCCRWYNIYGGINFSSQIWWLFKENLHNDSLFLRFFIVLFLSTFLHLPFVVIRLGWMVLWFLFLVFSSPCDEIIMSRSKLNIITAKTTNINAIAKLIHKIIHQLPLLSFYFIFLLSRLNLNKHFFLNFFVLH